VQADSLPIRNSQSGFLPDSRQLGIENPKAWDSHSSWCLFRLLSGGEQAKERAIAVVVLKGHVDPIGDERASFSIVKFHNAS
jgi:hypothetical protein